MTLPVTVDPAVAGRSWPLVIVGGGPAAARQIAHSRVPPGDVLLMTGQLGGWMRAMGDSRLQSYAEELAVGPDIFHPRTVFGETELQPTGQQYAAYVADQIRRSGARVAFGEVRDVRPATSGRGLHVEFVASGAAHGYEVRAERVVLATGTRPRRP
nr:hypothetical protein [Micromonospora sp. DSM 115978]